MISVGIDSVEIKRIEKLIQKGSFLTRIFGLDEYAQLESRKFLPQSVAVNFCAKEAFLKCIGEGLGSFPLKDIGLLRKESGQPYLKLTGKALDFATQNKLEFSVSATHMAENATVVVICERK